MDKKTSKIKRCSKHPKYNGKKLPKNKCEPCLTYYFLLHTKPRMPVKPSKVFKDISKYSRKNKHKKIGE